MDGPDLNDPVSVLALTAWGEARGGGILGMHSVINVVMNRVNNPRWWGHDIISVCRCAEQFDCWMHSDPNYPKMLTLTVDDSAYIAALGLAYTASKGWLPDLTQNADSYYALYMRQAPDWTLAPSVHTVDIAGQSFWRTALAAPATA